MFEYRFIMVYYVWNKKYSIKYNRKYDFIDIFFKSIKLQYKLHICVLIINNYCNYKNRNMKCEHKKNKY